MAYGNHWNGIQYSLKPLSFPLSFYLCFSFQFYVLFQVHYTPQYVDIQQQVQNAEYWIC